MLSISAAVRYYWYGQATDMRKGFDSLSGLVRERLQREPAQGEVYIFINARRNQIKLLAWEGDGLALYYKRLEKGTYEMPRQQGDGWHMGSQELMLILQGIVLRSVRKRERYERKQPANIQE
jgi:transposase